MDGRGSSLSQNHSIGDSSKMRLRQKHAPEEKGKGYLYPIDKKVFNDLKIITKAYAKKIGGLPIISVLPRREYQKKDHRQLEDSVLVEYLEEMVEAALQEVDQPLDQLDPDSPYCSPFQTPIQS